MYNSGLPCRRRSSLNVVTVSVTPKLWSSFPLMVCTTALLCGFRTTMGLDLKESTLDPITGTATLHCPTPGSRLIIYSAEFSPASERFCDRLTCRRSHSGANTTDCRLAHGGATGRRSICNRKFPAEDVWRLYEWCRDSVTGGKPCYLRGVDGLSQGGAYLVRYYCVEDIPPPDPCSFVRYSDNNDLYHSLSSSTLQRQCTCTGSVRFREASDRKSILLHISYIIMVDPMSPISSSSSPTGPSRDILRATVTSEKDEEKLNASSTPDFLLVMVTHQSPVFVFMLQIREREGLLGFIWLHVRDREVNISCTRSKEFTMVATSTKMPTVLSSAISVNPSIDDSDTHWLTLSAVAAAGGALAVLIILVTLFIVLKRSRRTPAQSIPPPPAGTGGERAHTRPSNSAYEEVDQFSRQNPPDQQHPYHHYRHNPTSSHTSVHVPKPLTGCDVNDYARLQHGHEEKFAAPSGSEGVPDNYDHVMRGRGDYFMLERESPRQEVLDNEYDHTGWNA